MDIVAQIEFPSSVQTVCLGPEGDRIAVVAGVGDSYPYSFTEPRRDQTLHLYRLNKGRLIPEKTFTLSPAPKWLDEGDQVRIRYNYFPARALFRDARTLLIARGAQPVFADRRKRASDEVEVFALDLETGEEHGRYTKPDEAYVTGLALAPPHHLLLGIQKTAVCLEADSLRKVCLVREIDEEGDPAEEDAIPEECLPPDGLAYDAERGLLYLQCVYFNAVVHLCYRFEEETQTFVRVSRSREYEGFVASGLRLNSDGSGVTGSFLIMDKLLDLWGRPFANFDFDQVRRVAREQQRLGGVPMPKTVPLGSVGILSAQSEHWIEIVSDLAREFPNSEACFQEADGTILHYGYRFGAGDTYMTRPVYLDDRRLVVGTPSGFLQLVDAVSGETTVVHDLGSAINSLIFCPQPPLLLAGCENGMLTVFSVAG